MFLPFHHHNTQCKNNSNQFIAYLSYLKVKQLGRDIPIHQFKMAGPTVKQQRRKASVKSKVTTSQQHASSSISSFARVSKTTTTIDVKKEQRTQITTPKKELNLKPITPASRKRKVVASVEDDTSADETPTKFVLPAVKSARKVAQPVKRGRPSKKPRSTGPEPSPNKRARSPSVSDSEESVNAGTLFKRLRLESSPSRCSSPLTAETALTDSEVDIDLTAKPGQLPNEVLALIDLHSSFLKTLTLHYVHNGSNVPADLRILCPNVARAWGKKKVTDADIRICLGVLNLASSNASQIQDKPLFTLSNYGRGKICVETDSAQHGSRCPLNEKKLNGLFHDNLMTLWSQFITANNGEANPATFTSTLPKAPVTLCASLAKAAPVLLKGQKRLEELKHGIAIKKQEKEAKITANKLQQQKPQGSDAPATTTATDAPKMSLLDRIRLKSLQKASAPAGLTPAQLERRAALQRAPEVAALLGMLSRAGGQGGSRVSFTMAATLIKLKDSFRMGISREEGAVCVRLLAAEVAPEWVRVITIGGRENVVIEVDREISRNEVEGRVRGLLERE